MSKFRSWVIAVANQKGGAGKTTLAAHLAVQAHHSGDGSVAVLDTDPQGTLAAWYNDRVAEDIVGYSPDMPRLAEQIEELRQIHKIIIIDTPPSRSPAITQVIRIADDVLIPLCASPNDVRAVGATMDIAEDEGKSCFFVVNRAKPNTKLTTKTVAHLSLVGQVAPAIVCVRDGFAAAMADGRTLLEIDPRNPGVAEIAELWQFLKDRLDGKIQPRKRR